MDLFSAGDALGQCMIVAQILHETEHGEFSAAHAPTLRGQGGFLPMALYVGAMSALAAKTATFSRIPAEKPLLFHVQFLRDLLDKKVLASLG